MKLFSRHPVLVQIRANVAWQVAQDPQDGHWLGVCWALNLNAMGDTWTDFQACADEAMQLLMRDLFECGELEGFLRERGFQLVTELPPRRTPVRFDVPFTIERKSRSEELVPA